MNLFLSSLPKTAHMCTIACFINFSCRFIYSNKRLAFIYCPMYNECVSRTVFGKAQISLKNADLHGHLKI